MVPRRSSKRPSTLRNFSAGGALAKRVHAAAKEVRLPSTASALVRELSELDEDGSPHPATRVRLFPATGADGALDGSSDLETLEFRRDQLRAQLDRKRKVLADLEEKEREILASSSGIDEDKAWNALVATESPVASPAPEDARASAGAATDAGADADASSSFASEEKPEPKFRWQSRIAQGKAHGKVVRDAAQTGDSSENGAVNGRGSANMIGVDDGGEGSQESSPHHRR